MRSLEPNVGLDRDLSEVPRRARSALARAEELSRSFAGLFGPETGPGQRPLTGKPEDVCSGIEAEDGAASAEGVDGAQSLTCTKERGSSCGSTEARGRRNDESNQDEQSQTRESVLSGRDCAGNSREDGRDERDDGDDSSQDRALGRYSEGRYSAYAAEVDEEMAVRRAAGEAAGDLAAGADRPDESR